MYAVLSLVTIHFALPFLTANGRSGTSNPLHASNSGFEDSRVGEDLFLKSMVDLGFAKPHQETIVRELSAGGLLDLEDPDVPTASHTLWSLTHEFFEDPAALARLLIQDFGMSPLAAHQTRAALLHAFDDDLSSASRRSVVSVSLKGELSGERNDSSKTATGTSNLDIGGRCENSQVDSGTPKPALYKDTVVNENAKRRKGRTPVGVDTSDATLNDYGLPRDYAGRYPKLASELADFETFMTQPSTRAQEAPIRSATANVYLRHAKLFLGWYLQVYPKTQLLATENRDMLSLDAVIPSSDKESATCVVDFIIWLRTHRQISVSYEANMLRGLTKMMKFRFRDISQADPSYGDKSFTDIPAVRELRKLHREANRKQAVSPRSSDEDRKWLSWPEYLQVVRSSREAVEELLQSYDDCDPQPDQEEYTPKQRKVAITFQKFLILAFFANVPDRQRTIRELQIGRSFVKDSETGCWSIKHAPEDYKTGKTYGERPPLHLSTSLTPAIDDFLRRWRPCLRPRPAGSNHLFVQVRTGKPLTQDSVYQAVARSCHLYTGKRTNPHLLRDMIVTHVRESSASEQELEALALYMGHSIQIQRASYDRRTLSKKVAPAVALLESVNNAAVDSKRDVEQETN